MQGRQTSYPSVDKGLIVSVAPSGHLNPSVHKQVYFLQSILWQIHIPSSCQKQIPSKTEVLRWCIG